MQHIDDVAEGFQAFPALAEAIRSSARGRAAAWPAGLGRAAVLLERHGMVPLVYFWTRDEALRDAAVHAAAAEPLRVDDLRAVLAALGSAGITTLIVKGTALAYSLYPLPEFRPRIDTDLLVSRDDFDRAAATLTSAGFEAVTAAPDGLSMRQQSFQRFDRLGLLHSYDLHLDALNNAAVAGVLCHDWMLRRSGAIPAISAGALAPCDVDALIYACVHRAVHHHQSDRLIWLYDIDLLRRRMTQQEHEEFWRLAMERRVVRICADSIARSEEWFGPIAGGEAERWLSRAQIVASERSAGFLAPRRQLEILAGDLAAMPGWRARASRLRQLVLPPRSAIAHNYRVGRKWLLPWFYFWRAVRGTARLWRRAG